MELPSQRQKNSKKETEPTSEVQAVTAEIEMLESNLSELRTRLQRISNSRLPAKTSIKETTRQAAQKPPSFDHAVQRQILMLTEAMPHMVWIADEEGKTTHANQRFYEFSGFNRDTDDGWAWVHVLHPEDLKKAIEAGNEASRKNVPFSLEVRCKDKSGRFHWSLLHSIPFFDPDSNSTKWYGTLTNIEEQKRAQDELRRSEEQFRTLADAIPHIVFVADENGEISFWNHRWFEYSGLTEEQSTTDAWQLLIHPDDLSGYMRDWNKCLKTGDTFETEFRVKRAVGRKKKMPSQYLWHLVRAIALRDADDNICNWFGTWTEIEGQKRQK